MVGTVARLNAEQQQTPTHTAAGKQFTFAQLSNAKRDRTGQAGREQRQQPGSQVPSPRPGCVVLMVESARVESGEWGLGLWSKTGKTGHWTRGELGGRLGEGALATGALFPCLRPGPSLALAGLLWRRLRGQDWPSDRRFFGYRVPHSVGDSERDLLDASERTGDCLPRPALAGLLACASGSCCVNFRRQRPAGFAWAERILQSRQAVPV